MYNCIEVNYMYLWNVNDEQAGETRSHNHKYSKTIGSINKIVFGQHETEWSTDTNQDHNNVYSNAAKSRVIDEAIFDISALVSKE